MFYDKVTNDGKPTECCETLPMHFEHLTRERALKRKEQMDRFNYCGCDWLPGHDWILQWKEERQPETPEDDATEPEDEPHGDVTELEEDSNGEDTDLDHEREPENENEHDHDQGE